jgi:RNAse (barnase) inhibitor barstar
MCTEFILALLYFFIIFFSNYFLIRILKKSFQNTRNWLKIFTIFKAKKMNEKTIFLSLIQLKNNRNPFQTFELLDSQIKKIEDLKQDIVIFANLAKVLVKNLDSNIDKPLSSVELNIKIREKNFFFSNQVYLTLLQQQLMS